MAVSSGGSSLNPRKDGPLTRTGALTCVFLAGGITAAAGRCGEDTGCALLSEMAVFSEVVDLSNADASSACVSPLLSGAAGF